MTARLRPRYAGIAVAIVVAALIPVGANAFWLNVVTLIAVFSVFAVSINLLAGYGGMITLGQGGTLAVAAYAVAYASTHLRVGYVEQILLALGCTVAVSAVFGALAIRTTRVYFLMVTLAEGMLIWGLAYSLSNVTGGENGLPNVDRPPFVNGADAFYYLCLVVLVVVLAAVSVFVRSPFGLGMRAIRSNESRARASGYNTTLHRFLAFLASGLIAGVSGILYVYLSEFISPSAAYFQMSADGMVMAMIGGLGTLVGPVVGAIVVVLIKNVLSGHISRWPTVEGVIFILIVLYARQGLVGLVIDARDWVRRRARGVRASPTGTEHSTASDDPPDEPDSTAHELAGRPQSPTSHPRRDEVP